MRIWQVYFTYDEHEMESDLFCAADDIRPSTTDADKMLLDWYGDDYMADAIDRPELLKVEQVTAFDTIVSLDGQPYKLTVQE